MHSPVWGGRFQPRGGQGLPAKCSGEASQGWGGARSRTEEGFQVLTRLFPLPGMWFPPLLASTSPAASGGLPHRSSASPHFGFPEPHDLHMSEGPKKQLWRHERGSTSKAHPSSGLGDSAVYRLPSSWIRGRCLERIFCWEMEPRKGRFFSMRHSAERVAGQRLHG